MMKITQNCFCSLDKYNNAHKYNLLVGKGGLEDVDFVCPFSMVHYNIMCTNNIHKNVWTVCGKAKVSYKCTKTLRCPGERKCFLFKATSSLLQIHKFRWFETLYILQDYTTPIHLKLTHTFHHYPGQSILAHYFIFIYAWPNWNCLTLICSLHTYLSNQIGKMLHIIIIFYFIDNEVRIFHQIEEHDKMQHAGMTKQQISSEGVVFC